MALCPFSDTPVAAALEAPHGLLPSNVMNNMIASISRPEMTLATAQATIAQLALHPPTSKYFEQKLRKAHEIVARSTGQSFAAYLARLPGHTPQIHHCDTGSQVFLLA